MIEFQHYWNHHWKCIQISTNMASNGYIVSKSWDSLWNMIIDETNVHVLNIKSASWSECYLQPLCAINLDLACYFDMIHEQMLTHRYIILLYRHTHFTKEFKAYWHRYWVLYLSLDYQLPSRCTCQYGIVHCLFDWCAQWKYNNIIVTIVHQIS